MQCPLCCSSNNKIFHNWPDFRILECMDCGFHFTDLDNWSYPYEYKDYYKENESIDVNNLKNEWIGRRIKAILKHSNSGRSIDIGCGLGEVPIAMKKLGFNSEGLDESKNAIDQLRQHFPSVQWHCGNVSDVLPKLGCFDVVTLYHILEHIPNPIQAMRDILKSVNREGIIVVEVPNAGGLQSRLQGINWHYYLPHHVNYFRPNDLIKMANILDCEVVSLFGDYDFTYPTGKKIKVLVKSILRWFGFKDVVTIILRPKS